MPSFSAPVVVTIAQRPSEPPTPAPQKAGPIPRDRDAIGRELQKELKRVGCYEGELNGIWTPSTRQAMKAFTDRVNATLPTDEPDSILLTLVQAYQDRVCGKPCPAGQGLSDTGRCLPTAILARAGKKGAPVAAATPAPPSREAHACHHELVDDHHCSCTHAPCGSRGHASTGRSHGTRRAIAAGRNAAAGGNAAAGHTATRGYPARRTEAPEGRVERGRLGAQCVQTSAELELTQPALV